MKSETEDPGGIVRPSQPPFEAFESPFVSWPVKRVFEHFKERYYEPFKDLALTKAPKVAGHNCVILDERTCSDGTCLLLSDTPAGDLYDNDLPHTARCEVAFALSVLGDCEIMNGDLVEYSMNYGHNPDHVLREKADEEDDAGEGGDENDNDDDDEDDGDEDDDDEDDSDEEDEGGEEKEGDNDEGGGDEDRGDDEKGGEDKEDGGDADGKGKVVEKRQEREEGKVQDELGEQDEPGKEGAKDDDAGHRSKRMKV